MPKAQLLPDDGLPSFPIVDPKATEAAQRILKFLQMGQCAGKDAAVQSLSDMRVVSEQILLLHRALMDHAKAVLPLLRSLDNGLKTKRSKEKPSGN